MRICLSSKFEIEIKNEIVETLRYCFPECNVKIIVKPIRTKNGKRRHKKNNKIKIIPVCVAEWIKDNEYKKERKEEEIQQVIDYYTGIKNIVDADYY